MFFLIFLKNFLYLIKTVFAFLSKPFFYFISFFFIYSSCFAANYIPLETLTQKTKEYFPNSIQTLQTDDMLRLDFDRFSADIFYSPQDNHYTALMPDDSRLTVMVKNTAMIVTWLDKNQENYKSALYRRADLRLPKKGRYFRIAPDKDDYFVSSPNFIESYAFWTGDEVMHAYDLLSYKEQGVIKLFPYISTEILHKLCHAQHVKAGFLKLLKHHSISCDDLNQHYSHLQSSDKFTKFQTELQAEKKLITKIFACNHGLTRPSECQMPQKALSQKVLSPQNIYTIF